MAQVLEKLEANGSGRLSWVDPYGDTQFDEQEAEVALGEIPGLLRRCADASETAAVNDLAALLKACASTPGSCLWFIGD
ncbi:hypothetical protein [Kitasatospora sp. NPDC093806]|uniref:hypothetical protein n=1 Tax=Kitasatospora sp. NPDC093806 TaxID=3155075 RepID=UPI00343B60AF